MGAKAIKLGSWDKYPAYCWDLNVERVVYEMNAMVYFQSGGRVSELVIGRS